MKGPTARIAYISARFPVLTETAVSNEVFKLRERGIDIEVISLLPPAVDPALGPSARSLLAHTRYRPLSSWRVPGALMLNLARRPRRTLGALAAVMSDDGVSIVRRARSLYVFLKANDIARSLEDQVARLHSHFATSGAIAAFIVHKLTKTPYSVTVHAHDIQVVRGVIKKVLQQADFVVSNSMHNARLLTEEFDVDPQRVHVIRTGVDLTRFRPGHKRRDSMIRLLAVGRIDPSKGYQDLVQACSALAKRGVAFMCTIVGRATREADSRAELEAVKALISAHRLEHSVRLAGAVSQEELLQHYRTSDIFVLPCAIHPSGRSDGLPSSIIEAMACRLPVVSTPISGIPEAVREGKTGFLIRPGDVDQLADRLRLLINNTSLRDSMGEASLAVAQREWDIERTCAQMQTLFEAAYDS